MDIINYVCRLCNYSEQIPKDVVRYFDLMDDGDPTVPPRFSCKYCAGEMYPAEKWNDIEGEDDFDEDKMISKYFPLLKVSGVVGSL